MEIRTYLAILRRRKWSIAVTVITTLLVVVVGTFLATPTYQAAVTLRVLTPTTGTIDWVEYDTQLAERLMNTYAEIATSASVLEELAEKLNLEEPPKIAVEAVADTELLRITVEDSDPLLAREAANALAEILMAQSNELTMGGGRSAQDILGEQLAMVGDELNLARQEYENLAAQSNPDSDRISAAERAIASKESAYATLLKQSEQVRVREAMQANMLAVAEAAATPRVPAEPQMLVNIAMGFVVGLMGGVALAFLFENLDPSLSTTQQIEEAVASPALGKIPIAERQLQAVCFDSNSAQAEAFRRLRAGVLHLNHESRLRTLLVTSTEPGEGKSTVVANLAVALAAAGRRVVVVDGDLRRPMMHQVFGLPNEDGLSSLLMRSLLEGQVVLEPGIQGSGHRGVSVLTSGPPLNIPAEFLGLPEMTALIKQLTKRFDMVLVDTPAYRAATDAAVVAPNVDGVILVVGRGLARREAVKDTRRELADIGARLVGVVVNQAERDGRDEYRRQGRMDTASVLKPAELAAGPGSIDGHNHTETLSRSGSGQGNRHHGS